MHARRRRGQEILGPFWIWGPGEGVQFVKQPPPSLIWGVSRRLQCWLLAEGCAWRTHRPKADRTWRNLKKASRMYSPLDGAMAGPLAMISLDGPPYPLRSPSEMRSRKSTWTGPDAGVSDDKRRANGPKAELTAANVAGCYAARQRLLLNALHMRDTCSIEKRSHAQ